MMPGILLARVRAGLVVLSLCCLAAVGPGCRGWRAKRNEARTARVDRPVISALFMVDPGARSRILRGIYGGPEEWSWTARVFAVSLDPPPDKPAYLEMDFALPRELIGRVGPVVLTARVNRVEVGRQSYDKNDRHLLARPVPSQALKRRPAEVEFELDKSVTDAARGRVLGLIVVSITLKEYEATKEFRDTQLRLSNEGYEKVLKARNLQIPLAKQRELMKLFHELPVWENMWFHDVRIIKSPLDLWMMQQIIYEVQPDFVIETGTWYGGSALYFAHALQGMGLDQSRVLTIDVQDFTKEGASVHFLWKKYVEFFHGSSTDLEIVSGIAKRVQGRKVFVTLDSDHHMQHVLRDLRSYAPMISRGSYLVVEDTHLDGVPTHPEQGAGPMAAVRQFLAEGGSQEFEQDFKREALVMTFNPGGWLRKK